MRIALFSGNYNYLREGANQALNRLAAHLEAQEHEVRVYSPVTDTPAFAPAGTLIPVPSIALPVRSEFRLALGMPRAIRRDVEEFAPDVVHIATPDILGTRAQSFARRLRIPVVASLHTRFEAYPDYYRLGWAKRPLEAHLRRFYRRSDLVLVPTPAILEEMQALRGDGQVRVWSRGVDRTLFTPERRDEAWRRAQGWSDEDIVILFFGRLVVEKGADAFVSVARRLWERGHPIRPLVVGAGPAAARFASLPGAVLTGHLDGEALARAVASADILVHPSTTETFGNVVLEAMASGLAIVGADVASARALVEDGATGTLTPPEPGHHAAAVEALIGSPEARRRLGAAARAASAAYDWGAASRSVERAYGELLGGGSTP